MKAPQQPAVMNEIPVWYVEVLEGGCGYVQYHLRLSAEVALWLEGRLRVLLAKKKIGGYQIQRVDELVVPALQFYDRYGLDR